MLEEPNRKKVDKQDDTLPTNIEQLIEKYDLNKVWTYTDKLINASNTTEKQLKDLDTNKLDKTGGTISGDLSINRNVEVGGTIDVGGKTTLKDTTINGNEEVTGHMAIGKKYDTSRTTDVLQVGGNTSVDGNLFFRNNADTGGQAVRWWTGSNDGARVLGGATAQNAGFLEMATADDGNEPIYVRQYTGDFATVKRTLTLLDGSGNTSLPGNLTIGGLQVDGDEVVDGNIDGQSISENGTNINTIYLKGGDISTSSFDDVDSGEKLQRSGLFSANIGNTWYNLINIRHRNGEGDGINYGLQIRTKLTSNEDLSFRHQYNGTWHSWKTIPTLASVYPVGAIYISTSSTSPASLFGGTWEQLKDRFLIGAGNSYAVNATGGATTVALETTHMPSHNHKLTGLSIETNNKTSNHLTMQADGNFVMYSNNGALWDSGTGNSGSTNKYGWTIGRTTDGTNTDSKGSGTAHNNMPPYLAVYMWKRTA